MVKSIRLRMQIWYALVLAAVIASFAAVVYLRAHQAVLQRADAQLLAATRYLEATLRSFPPHELDATLPPDPPPGTRSPPPPEPRRPPRDSQDRPVGPPNGPPNGPPPGPLGFLPPGLFGGDPPRPPEDRPANQRPPNHGPNDRPPNERPPNDSENNSPPGPENRPRPGEAGPNRPNPAGSLPREKDISVFYGELDLHDVRDPKYDDPIKPMYFLILPNYGRVPKAPEPHL